MKKQKSAVQSQSAEEQRVPDVHANVLRWLDAKPVRTEMVSKTSRKPKFQRKAIVLDLENVETEITVVGTEAQFKACNGSNRIEGYVGTKNPNDLYWQPALKSVASVASKFVPRG